MYPEGVSLPAVGLKTFSGLSTSRWADGNAGRDRTHVVLVPTFPILRAGESHNRKEKVSKLLETSDPGYPPLVFFPEITTAELERAGFRLAFRLRKPCSRAQPHQGSTACRGNKTRLYRNVGNRHNRDGVSRTQKTCRTVLLARSEGNAKIF